MFVAINEKEIEQAKRKLKMTQRNIQSQKEVRIKELFVRVNNFVRSIKKSPDDKIGSQEYNVLGPNEMTDEHKKIEDNFNYIHDVRLDELKLSYRVRTSQYDELVPAELRKGRPKIPIPNSEDIQRIDEWKDPRLFQGIHPFK